LIQIAMSTQCTSRILERAWQIAIAAGGLVVAVLHVLLALKVKAEYHYWRCYLYARCLWSRTNVTGRVRANTYATCERTDASADESWSDQHMHASAPCMPACSHACLPAHACMLLMLAFLILCQSWAWWMACA
jgi:hypothetical protein